MSKFINKRRSALLNSLCRVCGQEDTNCIPIFGESGKKQEIHKKIHHCLPVIVEEADPLPKQICLSCLHKLDATWELFLLCKQGQVTITTKLHKAAQIHEFETQARNNGHVENLCGVCNVEVQENELGIGCEGSCQRWHHCRCVDMSRAQYFEMVNDSSKTWVCDRCRQEAFTSQNTIRQIEDTIRSFPEKGVMNIGESAVITMAPPSPPPPPAKEIISPVAPVMPPVAAPMTTMTEEMMSVMPAQTLMASQAPVTYIQAPTISTMAQPQTMAAVTPVSVAVAQPQTPAKEVYPEGLVQVTPTGKPVVFQQRSTERKQQVGPTPRRSVPLPKPMPPPKRAVPPTPERRRALREGDSGNIPQPKRSLQLCKYCNKTFPDDIIDHHVNLHLRQSFFTCLDCNKNFRSEQAMSRHRCGTNDSINLDPDDEPICL